MFSIWTDDEWKPGHCKSDITLDCRVFYRGDRMGHALLRGSKAEDQSALSMVYRTIK